MSTSKSLMHGSVVDHDGDKDSRYEKLKESTEKLLSFCAE